MSKQNFPFTLNSQSITGIPNDNPAFDLIGLTQLRQDPKFKKINGRGISVAVIDSGIDYNNPLLKPNSKAGYNFVLDNNNPLDQEGHGTEVASIIGAEDSRIGVAPDVNLINLQVFNGEDVPDPNIERALQWVFKYRNKYNIKAVNLSLGDGIYTNVPQARQDGDILYDDIKKLEKAGITVVASAGNDYKDNQYQNLASPAIYSTLAVGAVWQDGVNSLAQWAGGSEDFTTGADRLVSFSQRLNSSNMIFAPGALLTTLDLNNQIKEEGGTSQAAPIVTGAVALMQQAAKKFAGRYLSPREIRQIIRSTATPIVDGDNENTNVKPTNITYRRINIYKAIARIRKSYAQAAPTAKNLSSDTLIGQAGVGNREKDVITKTDKKDNAQNYQPSNFCSREINTLISSDPLNKTPSHLGLKTNQTDLLTPAPFIIDPTTIAPQSANPTFYT